MSIATFDSRRANWPHQCLLYIGVVCAICKPSSIINYVAASVEHYLALSVSSVDIFFVDYRSWQMSTSQCDKENRYLRCTGRNVPLGNWFLRLVTCQCVPLMGDTWLYQVRTPLSCPPGTRRKKTKYPGFYKSHSQ